VKASRTEASAQYGLPRGGPPMSGPLDGMSPKRVPPELVKRTISACDRTKRNATTWAGWRKNPVSPARH